VVAGSSPQRVLPDQLLAGLLDGDLIQNVSSDGLASWGVARGGVLPAAAAVVGLLAASGRSSCVKVADGVERSSSSSASRTEARGASRVG
jgi:hypothetical protein